MTRKRTDKPVRAQVIGPCPETQGRDVMEALDAEWDERKKQFIAKCVDRFLGWPLPKSVCADFCATDSNYPHQRSGTNLLNADEARAMLEYVLNVPYGTPQETPFASDRGGEHGKD
jgi:hypothetical protein